MYIKKLKIYNSIKYTIIFFNFCPDGLAIGALDDIPESHSASTSTSAADYQTGDHGDNPDAAHLDDVMLDDEHTVESEQNSDSAVKIVSEIFVIKKNHSFNNNKNSKFQLYFRAIQLNESRI